MPTIDDIRAAHARISTHIHQTPIVESHLLNQWLGHRILFKAECLQRTGAFKVRGALNAIGRLAQSNRLPQRIVANSSGNHAQAVSFAAQKYGIPAKIFSTENVSAVKAAATRYYGAELALYPTRPLADVAVQEAAREPGTVWIPPFNHPDIIAGQGTLFMDAHTQTGDVDVVAVPCGGGGLSSGTLIAARALNPDAKVIGAEPLAANDAAQSLRAGKIVALDGPPVTLADGAATPSVGEHTFPFLQQMDGFYEVEEHQIAYWTQWLHHLLKLHIEPTCAMTMAAVCRWLRNTNKTQTVLVLISGGNIDQRKMQQIWETDYLTQLPSLDTEVS